MKEIYESLRKKIMAPALDGVCRGVYLLSMPGDYLGERIYKSILNEPESKETKKNFFDIRNYNLSRKNLLESLGGVSGLYSSLRLGEEAIKESYNLISSPDLIDLSTLEYSGLVLLLNSAAFLSRIAGIGEGE